MPLSDSYSSYTGLFGLTLHTSVSLRCFTRSFWRLNITVNFSFTSKTFGNDWFVVVSQFFRAAKWAQYITWAFYNFDGCRYSEASSGHFDVNVYCIRASKILNFIVSSRTPTTIQISVDLKIVNNNIVWQAEIFVTFYCYLLEGTKIVDITQKL